MKAESASDTARRASGSGSLRQELERERQARVQAEARAQELEAQLRNGTADGAIGSRFVAGMGHTLRTPLNGVIGYADVLLEGTFGALSARQTKCVEQIIESGQRQLELINNLIDLCKIHAGEIALECASCNIAELVEGAVDEWRSRAQERGLTIETHTDGHLGAACCDANRVRQVLGNLLSNAIRATDPGGRISVVAELAHSGTPNPDSVRIQVCDTGAGIPPDDQALLFDDLNGMDSMMARRQRRSGTGLALARRILEMHGGRISVESDGHPGHGSRFTLDLPLRGAA